VEPDNQMHSGAF